MSYDDVWKATKSALLVTWSVLFSFGFTVLLNFLGVVQVDIPFSPSKLTYFFGALQSSAFAVFYIDRSDWTYSVYN
jgi:hypothetical protein